MYPLYPLMYPVASVVSDVSDIMFLYAIVLGDVCWGAVLQTGCHQLLCTDCCGVLL